MEEKQLAQVVHTLRLSVEHLACGGYPKQNWGQFMANVELCNVFTPEEIARWNKIRFQANDSDRTT